LPPEDQFTVMTNYAYKFTDPNTVIPRSDFALRVTNAEIEIRHEQNALSYSPYYLTALMQNIENVDETGRLKTFEKILSIAFPKTSSHINYKTLNNDKGIMSNLDAFFAEENLPIYNQCQEMLIEMIRQVYKEQGYPVNQTDVDSLLNELETDLKKRIRQNDLFKWVHVARDVITVLVAVAPAKNLNNITKSRINLNYNYAGKNIGGSINAKFKGANIFAGQYKARGYVGTKGIQITYKNNNLSYKLYPVNNQSQISKTSQTPNNVGKVNTKTNTNTHLLPYQNYETADKKLVVTHIPKSDVVFTQATVKALQLDKSRDIDFLTYTPEGSKKTSTLVTLADGTKALIDKPEYLSNGQMIRLRSPENPEQLMGIGYWSTEHQKIYRGGLKGGGEMSWETYKQCCSRFSRSRFSRSRFSRSRFSCSKQHDFKVKPRSHF
jgi:hypothetical protein